MYDDKILIFYNTDDNHPTVIKRKDTEELISHLNDIASNGKTVTDDCPNTTGNNSPIVQKENSLEPQGFKRVSLGGQVVIAFELFSLLLSYRQWSISQYLYRREY